MNNLGVGVMLGMLRGNEKSVEAITASLGKEILSIEVGGDELKIGLAGGPTIILRDEGQSCCEHRYMRTDDDLAYHVGSKLHSLELRDAPEEKRECGDVHEVQFLLVTTSKGVVTIANHNEHNGYYGGFWIQAYVEEAKA